MKKNVRKKIGSLFSLSLALGISLSAIVPAFTTSYASEAGLNEALMSLDGDNNGSDDKNDLFKENVKVDKEEIGKVISDGHEFGLVYTEDDKNYGAMDISKATRAQLNEGLNVPTKLSASAYSSSYDARRAGKVTPIKDQAWSGTCWAFGTIASAEGNYKSRYGVTRDFSEIHMANNVNGYYTINSGGGTPAAVAYLARLNGLVSESSYPSATSLPRSTGWINSSGRPVSSGSRGARRDPFYEGGAISSDGKSSDVTMPGHRPLDDLNTSSRVHRKTTHKVGNIEKLSASNRTAIKQAIIDNGVVMTSFWVDHNRGFDSSGKFYHYPSSRPNHAVAIVGWDDNKMVRTPAGSSRGAWLVKNSWGTDSGDRGYFWGSYESFDGVDDYEVVTDVTSVSGSSIVGQYNNMYWGAFGRRTVYGDTTYAVSFNKNFSGRETLDELSFVAYTDSPFTYKVYITQKDDWKSSTDPAKWGSLVASGVSGKSGYQTIKFDNSVGISSASSKFTAILVLSPGSTMVIPTPTTKSCVSGGYYDFASSGNTYEVGYGGFSSSSRDFPMTVLSTTKSPSIADADGGSGGGRPTPKPKPTPSPAPNNKYNKLSMVVDKLPLKRGKKTQFYAKADGKTLANSKVSSWWIDGNNSSSTKISSSGLVSVASNETSSKIYVNYKLTNGQSARAYANVDLSGGNKPSKKKYNDLGLSASVIPVRAGGSSQFYVTNNDRNINQREIVGWRVKNNGSSYTKISSGGKLTVSRNETSKRLDIYADLSNGQTASAYVNVTGTKPKPKPQPNPPKKDKYVARANKTTVLPGESFNVSMTKNGIDQTMSFYSTRVTGNTSSDTQAIGSLILVGDDEKASKLTVVISDFGVGEVARVSVNVSGGSNPSPTPNPDPQPDPSPSNDTYSLSLESSYAAPGDMVGMTFKKNGQPEDGSLYSFDVSGNTSSDTFAIGTLLCIADNEKGSKLTVTAKDLSGKALASDSIYVFASSDPDPTPDPDPSPDPEPEKDWEGEVRYSDVSEKWDGTDMWLVRPGIQYKASAYTPDGERKYDVNWKLSRISGSIDPGSTIDGVGFFTLSKTENTGYIQTIATRVSSGKPYAMGIVWNGGSKAKMSLTDSLKSSIFGDTALEETRISGIPSLMKKGDKANIKTYTKVGKPNKNAIKQEMKLIDKLTEGDLMRNRGYLGVKDIKVKISGNTDKNTIFKDESIVIGSNEKAKTITVEVSYEKDGKTLKALYNIDIE